MGSMIQEVVGWVVVAIIAIALIITDQPLENWMPFLSAILGYLIPSPLLPVKKESDSYEMDIVDATLPRGLLTPESVARRPPIPTRLRLALKKPHVQRGLAFLALLTLTSSWAFHDQTHAQPQPPTGLVRANCSSCYANDKVSRPCLDALRDNTKAIRIFTGDSFQIFPIPLSCQSDPTVACYRAKLIDHTICEGAYLSTTTIPTTIPSTREPTTTLTTPQNGTE